MASQKSNKLTNRTFDEWNERGYYIKKGSKAVGFTEEGDPVFTSEQVHKRKKSVGGTTDTSRYGTFGLYDNEEPRVRYYADGSSEVMFGGPCGSLFLDPNGES